MNYHLAIDCKLADVEKAVAAAEPQFSYAEHEEDGKVPAKVAAEVKAIREVAIAHAHALSAAKSALVHIEVHGHTTLEADGFKPSHVTATASLIDPEAVRQQEEATRDAEDRRAQAEAEEEAAATAVPPDA